MPCSRSAPAAPQKKNLFVPGRPCGHRQVSLVNSKIVMRRVPAGGVDWRRLFCPPRRRRASAVSARPCPADFALVGEAAAALSVRSRSRKTFPSTADRDIPSSRAAIAAAVSPSAQSFFNRSICSTVHASLRMNVNSDELPAHLPAPVRAGDLGRRTGEGGFESGALVTVCDYSRTTSDSQVTVLDARRRERNR